MSELIIIGIFVAGLAPGLLLAWVVDRGWRRGLNKAELREL